MDALGLDVYHTDYQENVREAEDERLASPSPLELRSDATDGSSLSSSHENSEPGSTPIPDPTGYYVGSDLASSTTVPVGGASLETEKSVNQQNKSTSSSSSSSSDRSWNFGTTSLYQQDFLAPKMSYDRENEQQKLVAIIGREFDRPCDVALSLQKLVPKQDGRDISVVKFVPFTLKRKVLLKGSFDNQELRKHDLICMCYNASEARILLTGPDGFYTSLLRHIQALLGRETNVGYFNFWPARLKSKLWQLVSMTISINTTKEIVHILFVLTSVSSIVVFL